MHEYKPGLGGVCCCEQCILITAPPSKPMPTDLDTRIAEVREAYEKCMKVGGDKAVGDGIATILANLPALLAVLEERTEALLSIREWTAGTINAALAPKEGIAQQSKAKQ